MDVEEKRMLVLGGQMEKPERCLAIETALLQGFLSESAEFPVVSVGKQSNTMRVWGETLTQASQKLTGEGSPTGYCSTLSQAKPLMDFDFRKKRGLENLFSIGSFLKDRDGDLLPDELDLKFCIPEDCDVYTLAAACTLAFRTGMELTAFHGPVTGDENEPGNKVLFRRRPECRMHIETRGEESCLIVEGEGKDLADFMNRFCQTFPYVDRQKSWADALQEMAEGFALRNINGQLAYGVALTEREQRPLKVYGSYALDKQTEDKLHQIYPKVQFCSAKEKKEVYKRVYDLPWEVDEFRDLLNQRVYPTLKAGDQVQIEGALSENKAVRRDLVEEIRRETEQTGAELSHSMLICAYKQGYSWIDEAVLPEAERLKAAKVVIRFRPFLPPGETEWHDENGATPSYTNLGKGDPNHWYDLPIRFLQELYPIEDEIANRLKISKDAISLEVYKGQEDLTYEWESFTSEGKRVQYETYRAQYSERPYLDDYPNMGKVHPSTGWVKVCVNGNSILEERIQTDVERIWTIYQKNVLPECRAYVERKTDGNPLEEKQPFFSQLRLDIQVSEPNEELPSRNDLYSSLDGLHEDLYFVGTDYFKNYGMEKNGKVLDAPGLILPVIHQRRGKPSFCVTLYEPVMREPCIWMDGKLLACQSPREKIDCIVESVAWKDGRLVPYLLVEGVDREYVKAYTELWNARLLTQPLDTGWAGCPVWCAGGEKWQGNDWITPAKEPVSICDIPLMEHEVIGYEQYLRLIEQFSRVEGISVYQTATSYQGRKIYAIELLPNNKGYISRTKRLTLHPSEIINCRHHANEVSSTNAAFLLLRELLTDPKYAHLSEKLNLVIVPMENVDGAAIHYELQKENPCWKLHVARFNSVGKEFYYEHFKNDTIHTEARSFRWLWRTYLPDVVVDNHGVPTHEWEQQFSGYTSPSYKGFWLPRSLLYGYFWTVTGDAFKDNYVLNKKLEDVVAAAVEKNPDMGRWNREWMREFETYAHKWMPKLFPADYYKGMIDYWVPFAYDPDHRYPSIRFPWITSVAYTSEVADETAQGDYLRLCSQAHVTHDLAMIDALMTAKSVFQMVFQEHDTFASVKMTRQRPIIIPPKNLNRL